MKKMTAILGLMLITSTVFVAEPAMAQMTPANSKKYYLEKLEPNVLGDPFISKDSRLVNISSDSQQASILYQFSLDRGVWWNIDGSSVPRTRTQNIFPVEDRLAVFDTVIINTDSNNITNPPIPMIAYDKTTGKELWRKFVPYYGNDQLFFTGRFLYAYDWRVGTLRIIDPLTGNLLMEATDAPQNLNNLSWQDKLAQIWECNDSIFLDKEDYRLFEYSLKSFARTAIYPLSDKITAMSPQCQYVTLVNDSWTKVVDFRSGQQWSIKRFPWSLKHYYGNTIPYQSFGIQELFSKTGDYVVITTDDEGTVFNSKTGAEIGSLDVKTALNEDDQKNIFTHQFPVAIAADGNRVATYLPFVNKIAFWDRTIGPPTPSLPPEDTPEVKLLKKWSGGKWSGKKILNFSVSGTKDGASSFAMSFTYRECNSDHCSSTITNTAMSGETLWIDNSNGQNEFDILGTCKNGTAKEKFTVGRLRISDTALDLSIDKFNNLNNGCKDTFGKQTSFSIHLDTPTTGSVSFSNQANDYQKNWTDAITRQ